MSESVAPSGAAAAANSANQTASETEQLTLIPQWLKRGPSASPRHAQAPPPPPSAAAPPPSESASSRPPRVGGKDRTGPLGGAQGGRFQSFVQSEQQRRPPPQAGLNPSAQGTFEGGRFTMPGDESAGRPPRGLRADYGRPAGAPRSTGFPPSSSSQPPPPRVLSSQSKPPQAIDPGLRYFARDDLLDLATASTLDTSLFGSEIPEGILCSEWQEPELRRPLDTEEIYNAWYESLQSERKNSERGPGRQEPPRVGEFRGNASNNPPSWRSGAGKLDRATFGDSKTFGGSILPPSGGMGLDKMAEAAKRFADEMAQMSKPNKDEPLPTIKLQGLLGEPTGNSILDEPLEEGLDRPPEEVTIPEEEAIDYERPSLPTLPLSSATGSKRSSLPEVPSDELETTRLVHDSRVLPKTSLPSAALPQVPLTHSSSTGLLPQVPLDAFKQPASSSATFGGPSLPRLDAWSQPLGGGGVQQSGYGLDLLSPGGVFPSAKDYFKAQQPGVVPSQQPPQQQPPRSYVQPGLPPQVPMMMMPPADEWFYKDPQSAIQGPFTSKEMKEWLDAGYFKPDLPISFGQHGTGKFIPLIHMFPDLRQAFQRVPMMPSGVPPPQPNVLPVSLGPTIMPMGGPFMPQQQQQQMLRQHQDDQAQRQQRILEQQRLEQQAWARAAQEAPKVPSSPLAPQFAQQHQPIHQQHQPAQQQQPQPQPVQQQQPAQALPRVEMPQPPAPVEHQQQPNIQRTPSPDESAVKQAQQQQSAVVKKPAPWSAAATATPSTPTLQEIQAEEERLKQLQKVKEQQQRQQQTTPAKPAAAVPANNHHVESTTPSPAPAKNITPWGKSATETVRAPTLKEIQEMEAEARRRQLQQQPVQQSTSMASHLAKAAGINPAAPSSPVWAEPAVPKKAAIPESVLAPPAPASASKPKPAAAASASRPAAPSESKPSAPKQQQQQQPAQQQQQQQKGNSGGEFMQGAMSPEMRAWCVENAPKIGADITLLEFCYTIDSSEEVRETFAGYLGMKPPVMSFVDEFLRRAALDKAGTTAGHGEWKSGSAAAGGKGKTGKKRG